MFAFSTQFFKNMVYSNPEWDFRTFDPVRDTQTSDEKFARVLNSNDPDLKRFRDRGGKLILYHGWSDAAIPAYNIIDYYRSVEQKMGAPTSFVRLYMVPGMNMCSGGDGADRFDWLATMRTWVEQKRMPVDLVASRVVNGKTVRTRPLCAYPQVATYKGSGSTDEAANFVCR